MREMDFTCRFIYIICSVLCSFCKQTCLMFVQVSVMLKSFSFLLNCVKEEQLAWCTTIRYNYLNKAWTIGLFGTAVVYKDPILPYYTTDMSNWYLLYLYEIYFTMYSIMLSLIKKDTFVIKFHLDLITHSKHLIHDIHSQISFYSWLK